MVSWWPSTSFAAAARSSGGSREPPGGRRVSPFSVRVRVGGEDVDERTRERSERGDREAW